jgi:hypothetical protein
MRFFLPLFWIFCGVLLAAGETNEVAPGVLQIGTIENSDVNESSGLASSRKPNIVWTHNDTGKPVLYAMTPDGQSVADWELKNVDVKNWEDVTRSGNQLYVADIGNDDLSRDHVEVYRANEPSTKKSGDLKPNRAWRISYADQPFDAESLFIQFGFGYVIARNHDEGAGAQVYRFPLSRATNVTFEPQFFLNVDGNVTAASLSVDNKRLAVLTSQGAYLFVLPRKLPATGALDPYLFVAYPSSTSEGCTFTRDGLLVTGESPEILLFTAEPFHLKWRAPRQ